MRRFHIYMLILATLAISWLGMQAVHEAGHVLGALLTGGHVEKVVLHPLTISRTDLDLNPQPLLVVWAGPILGSLIPLTAWMIVARLKLPVSFLFRFFAGFCLIANGAYIGVGSFSRIGDCGEMLAQGSPLGTLWLFGLVTTPLGLWLWNGQGAYFGLGNNPRDVSPRLAYHALAMAISFALLGTLFV